MRRRIKLIAIEVAGAVAFLVPGQALASPEGSFNPGFLLSVGNGECTVGVGAELSGMYFPKGDPGSIGYGGFLQMQTYAGDYSRHALGFQLGNIVGAELGIAALTRSELHASTVALHTGVFASAAVLGTGLRVTIPMSGTDGGLPAHGVEASWVLTLKVPLYSGKIFNSFGRPLRDEQGPITAAALEASGWADVGDAALVAHLSPRTVARLSFTDGCIGETFAAALARRALRHATDPAVARALARIATDEARHAALAWSIVAWCLTLDPARVRAALGAALAEPEIEAQAAPLTDVLGLPIVPAARHGAVPVDEQKPLRRRAERTARARLKRVLRAPREARILTAEGATRGDLGRVDLAIDQTAP
ncbi:hypothetical protein ACSRUE_27310 [Sorangium sp. KYC3313]|uniref:hypothetical protein n=1 Tax=Sorangium sp. KYC3313 TaxID=3449740 RepID=UPI003F892613